MRVRALIVLALVALAPVARAQEPAPRAAGAAAAAAQGRADALLREGVELRKEGRESEALERFRQAYAIQPSARALGQMGLAAKSIRLYVEAERYLEDALAAAGEPWVVQNRAALEQALEIVARQLASLTVRSNVGGAELVVNGAVVATLPLERPVRVLAGAAHVQVRAPGHAPSESDATLPAGSTTVLSFELVPLAPAPAPAPRSTAAPVRSAPRSERPAPEPEPRPSLRPWIYAAAGVGVVGIGVGTVFGVMTLTKKSERDELCGPEPKCTSDEGVELDREARTAALWSNVSFGAGLVGLGAAAVLLLVEPSSKATAPAPKLAAGVTPAGGFVACSFRF